MKASDFFPGTLDMLVLQSLIRGPHHGYGIARYIERQSSGRFKVIDGALYAALHRLERRKWIASAWGKSDRGKRARFYNVTSAGRSGFRTEATRWYRYVSGVARILSARTGSVGDEAGQRT